MIAGPSGPSRRTLPKVLGCLGPQVFAMGHGQGDFRSTRRALKASMRRADIRCGVAEPSIVLAIRDGREAAEAMLRAGSLCQRCCAVAAEKHKQSSAFPDRPAGVRPVLPNVWQSVNGRRFLCAAWRGPRTTEHEGQAS